MHVLKLARKLRRLVPVPLALLRFQSSRRKALLLAPVRTSRAEKKNRSFIRYIPPKKLEVSSLRYSDHLAPTRLLCANIPTQRQTHLWILPGLVLDHNMDWHQLILLASAVSFVLDCSA